ncbi:MAG: peptidase C25 [Candidatus Thermoplasmatota archaeon]|nr:peptidase C25 [Candidatus Thermoplasmatota archaeon]
MKKILPIVVVSLLVLSAVGAYGFSVEREDDNTEKHIVTKTVTFSSPTIKKSDQTYLEVSVKEISSHTTMPGKPMIPQTTTSFELPFGATNVHVTVLPNNVQEHDLDSELQPSPAHIPLIADRTDLSFSSEKDNAVYESNELFPTSWYSTHVGCGLNNENKRVTHVSVHTYPLRYSPGLGKLYVAEALEITVTYDEGSMTVPTPSTQYDLVIIAPSIFSRDLQPLVEHKNRFGVDTLLKTTEEIYEQYGGIDKPEQIKYFIKDAIENWGITYVLLVGGLNSLLRAQPRDDANQGSRDWYVPVRYTNCFDNPEHPLSSAINDPGVISDLYYADIYKEGGVFEDWDPNGDGLFAAWGHPTAENDTGIDFYPDVSLGRLACRNKREVKAVVDKIITYEEQPADPSWFKRMVVISGDGFLDQEDLDIQWDIKNVSEGGYTICAQSINADNIAGPIDKVRVTINRKKSTSLSFNHDDHLKIDGYPAPPIAEITSPSDGDILGNTDYYEEPGEGVAYCNEFNGWANIEYINGIMHIRGKSYDPRPYGNMTDIHVWIEDTNHNIIFSKWRNDTEMYYEGEWLCGEKVLEGGGGALYYMPSDFEREIIWTSNGKLTGQQDVIDALNPGCGFAFLSGHGSPNVWADHYPGVPGNRGPGSVTGLKVTSIGIYPPFVRFPVFPMDKLRNTDKPPIVLIGGCHNSQFNVSMIPAFLDVKNKKSLWTHGSAVPECFSWYLIKLPKKGAIATIGNTGLGYGTMGKTCTIDGLDGGICIEFFKQYGQEGHHILGDAYTQTLRSYVSTFDMENQDHAKSLQQWVLLGDPSLKIGGYS